MRRGVIEDAALGHTMVLYANGDSWDGWKRSDQEEEGKSGKSNIGEMKEFQDGKCSGDS